jgi:L,D-transpeptidase catalytic domain
MNRRNFSLLAASGFGAAALGLKSRGASAQLVNKYAEQLKNGEFNWFPNRSPSGPLLIIVSIPDQIMHVYRNGIRVAASTCSTGKPGHRTPTGVFKILQKDKHHRSSTYSNAPMPNMNRLTWSGIALHAGNLPGYPASHGCVRLPMQFSEMLFGITRLGVTVVLADDNSQPQSVTHPGMVLGDYARREFAAVDVALKKSEYSEGYVAPSSTSVIVSRKDRSVQVFENDRVVAAGKADFKNPEAPVGNRIYTLSGSDDRKQDLRWISAGYSDSKARAAKADTLQHIKAEPAVREQIRRRMHNGMTVVVTDESAQAASVSSGDFVIMDGLY